MSRSTLRKSGIQLAQENYLSLKKYIESFQGAPLPRYGLELNQSAIAKACGFDRKVFQTNARCRQLLADAETAERSTLVSKVKIGERARESNEKADAERMQLEGQNLRLMAENASLRREIERLRRLKEVMTNTGRLP